MPSKTSDERLLLIRAAIALYLKDKIEDKPDPLQLDFILAYIESQVEYIRKDK